MPRMAGKLDDELVFSSGRKVYCPSGRVALPLEGEGMPVITYGSDDHLDDLHPDDARELADAMIGVWTRYKLSQPQ